MKIMGHRGAAGLALENTEAGIKKAIELGVDAIEIDVRKTKDNQLVLCHDDNLARVSAKEDKVKKLTLAELKKVTLNDRSKVPTLKEVLGWVGATPIMIELKDTGCARILLDLLRDFKKANVSVASFKLGELSVLRELGAKFPLYGLESTKPFDIIHFARLFDFNGIGLNHWLLNPVTYHRARMRKLGLYAYTVNSPIVFWFISKFYPSVTICTDRPDKFIKK